jgi:hypothetical protein
MNIPDYRLNTLKRFERPYFSPRRDSYEMDYMEHRGTRDEYQIYRKDRIFPIPEPGEKKKYIMRYLFCININTRYLLVYAAELNRKPRLETTLKLLTEMNTELMNTFGEERKIKHIRSDAESGFGRKVLEANPEMGPEELARFRNLANQGIRLGEFIYTANDLSRYLQSANIDLYLNPSKYTNKNRIVDRAIRTIRDKIVNQNLFFNSDIVRHIVDLYNRTPHAAFNYEFTPLEVQKNPDTENYFIRENNYKLQQVRQAQHNEGLFRYQRGNILLVHIPRAKTSTKFDKRRRNFDTLAKFDGYVFGNIQCFPIRVTTRGQDLLVLEKKLVIPIYFTKYVANDIFNIPWNYRLAFSDERGLPEEDEVEDLE